MTTSIDQAAWDRVFKANAVDRQLAEVALDRAQKQLLNAKRPQLRRDVRKVRLGRWTWAITDERDDSVIVSGHALTEGRAWDRCDAAWIVEWRNAAAARRQAAEDAA